MHQAMPLSPRRRPPLQAISAAEFLRLDIPPRELMLAPWLPCQGTAMIYAMRGIGKTFFGLEISYAVATGQSFLSWQAPKARRVLYLDGEMPAADLQARLSQIALVRGEVDPDYLTLLTPDLQPVGMPDLSRRDDQTWLQPTVEKADLIIVDNISTLCRSGGSENDAESWDVTQEWALRQKANGKTILFIHHAGKGGNQRGTSKREDILDTVIALRRPDDYDTRQGARVEVHFEKARGFSGDEASPFEARLNTEGGYRWQWQARQAGLDEQVLLLQQQGLKQGAIAGMLGKDKSTISRAVTRLRQAGKITADEGCAVACPE